MTLGVPPQGLTIKDRFFKTDTVTQPNGAIDLTAGKFPVLGLAAPTFLGSVFVDVTSVNGVRVEVGDRTRTSQGALTFESSDNEPGIFSLQAPPDESELTPATTASPSLAASSSSESDGFLKIESEGPLKISDPSPGVMTGATVISKQSIGVQSSVGEVVDSKCNRKYDVPSISVETECGQPHWRSANKQLLDQSSRTLNWGISNAATSRRTVVKKHCHVSRSPGASSDFLTPSRFLLFLAPVGGNRGLADYCPLHLESVLGLECGTP